MLTQSNKPVATGAAAWVWLANKFVSPINLHWALLDN